MSGTVQGPLIQARDIHGGIHVHHQASVFPTPAQLPASGILVGRGESLAVLDALRSGDDGEGVPKVAVVSGPAGIGKSAVALHWAHRERRGFPDGQLYADLRGHAVDDPVEPAEVLGRFLRAFGIAPERIPGELAERAALYQSLVSERHLIVVLDDALSAAQVVPLLPASANGLTLVTSRWRLAGLRSRGAIGVQLDRLSANAALELLSRTLGDDRVRDEPVAARDLVDLCARFPMALCVTAARLATRPRWTLAEMVEALSQERRRLIGLSVEDDMTIRAALTLSYQSLSPPKAAHAYRLLGLIPGTTFDSWTAAAALELPRTEVRVLLEVLTDANLLDDAPGGGYRFHDLIRLHARELAEQEDTAEVREAVVHRVLDWFLSTAWTASRTVMPYRRTSPTAVRRPAEPLTFSGPAQALDWLEHEFGNLRAAARTAFDRRMFRVTWELVDALWPLFLHRGHHAERLEIDLLGARAARASADPRAEAKMLNRTGLALRALGRTDEAAEHFGRALEIWHSLGDRARIASGQRRLGMIEIDRERPDSAVALFLTALEHYRESHDDRRVALTLCDLADALLGTGEERAAVGHLAEAHVLLQAAEDRYNRARVLVLLGRARLAEHEAAAGLLRQGLQEMRDLGSENGQAQALEALGELALRHRRPEEARRRFTEAQDLLARSGTPSERLAARLSRLDDG
jgi:tetratricopeptide (TPR) repeat protein